MWGSATEGARGDLGAATVTLFSVHNDSFVPTNNLAQAEWVARRARGRESVVAGDFNATPESPSMRVFRGSGRFVAVWDSPPTIPNANPDRAIDYILAPRRWELAGHHVLTNAASDHCAVAAAFRMPRAAGLPARP